MLPPIEPVAVRNVQPGNPPLIKGGPVVKDYRGPGRLGTGQDVGGGRAVPDQLAADLIRPEDVEGYRALHRRRLARPQAGDGWLVDRDDLPHAAAPRDGHLDGEARWEERRAGGVVG